jgi:protein-disulfide isomerase
LDLVIGNLNAPILVLEYASLTCGHCAAFHRDVIPGLQQEFITRGRAVLVYRDFPLDVFALGASLVTRAGTPSPGERLRRIGAFFAGQFGYLQTAQTETPLRALQGFGAAIGLTPAEVEGALSDGATATAIQASMRRAVEAGINSTPTVLINGRVQTPPAGGHSLNSLRPALVPAPAP